MTSTRPIEAADISHLVVRMGGGTIVLERNERPGVIGELAGKRAEDFLVEAAGTTLSVTAPKGRSTDARLRLAVPEGIDLTVTAGSCDLTVDVGVGTARVRSGSGEITMEQVGNIDASTGSGEIRVEDIVGATARLNTGSGEITVASCDAALRVRSGSGDIAIGALRAVLQGNTGSGEISIASTNGSVSARTGSGDVAIGVADGLAVWLDLTSSSGEVQVGLDQSEQPDPDTPYVALQVRTGSGDITVTRS